MDDMGGMADMSGMDDMGGIDGGCMGCAALAAEAGDLFFRPARTWLPSTVVERGPTRESGQLLVCSPGREVTLVARRTKTIVIVVVVVVVLLLLLVLLMWACDYKVFLGFPRACLGFASRVLGVE
jgi:hypothetical protein